MIPNAGMNSMNPGADRSGLPSNPDHAGKSIRKIAVLFTDIIGSTRFFQSHGNLAGRTMLQQHEAITSKAIIRFGGTVVKNLGDSILAYFADPQKATKAAVQIQKEFLKYNEQRGDGHKIHVRIGIHFDEGIVEDKDIFGNAVNIASKITDLAGSNQIFISHNVFTLVNSVPSLVFEALEIMDNDDAQPKPLLLYRVRWEESIDFAPTMTQTLYMRPLRSPGAGAFDTLWDGLIAAKDLFWEGRVDGETILEDQTVILTAKKLSVVMDVASDILTFLKEIMPRRSDVPVQVIVDASPRQETDRLARGGFRPEWEGIRPGTIFISPAVHHLIEEEKLSIATIPPLLPGEGLSFYEIAPNDYRQREREVLFPYQSTLSQGDNPPCFYCGSSKHTIQDCPSKHLTTVTDTLTHLGYLSFDRITNMFDDYLRSSEEVRYRELRSQEESRGQEPSAGLGFYELKQIYQLRFLRNIWDGDNNDWDTAVREKRKGDGTGELIWLAQDCIRVSNLSRAESILQTCLEKYPDDYRTYCTLAFLNMEQGGGFSQGEQYLNKALSYTRKVPQKMFILFLLCRLYSLTGDTDNALRKTREIKFIHPYCPEATYQEIVLNFHGGQESAALRRLVSLIRMNREYYVNALIDPDLAPFNEVIHPELKKLFTEVRRKAQKKAYEAGKEFASLKQFLVEEGEEETGKASALLLKIQTLVPTDSYFGYMDIVDFSDSVISICRRTKTRCKESLINTVKEIHERFDTIFDLIKDYHSQLSPSAPYRQLQVVHSNFKEILGATTFHDFSRFREMSVQCRVILKELSEIDLELRRLKMVLDIKRFFLIFLKNAAFILSIILFAGIVILPTVVYYLSTFYPGFDAFTGSDIRSYHKHLLIFGALGGLAVAFFKSFKTFFKHKG